MRHAEIAASARREEGDVGIKQGWHESESYRTTSLTMREEVTAFVQDVPGRLLGQ